MIKFILSQAALVEHWIVWWALSSEVWVQAWEGKTSKRSLAYTPQPTPFETFDVCLLRFGSKHMIQF